MLKALASFDCVALASKMNASKGNLPHSPVADLLEHSQEFAVLERVLADEDSLYNSKCGLPYRGI